MLKLALLGDVMTGRLIDQVFPVHCVPDTSEYKHWHSLNEMKWVRQSCPNLNFTQPHSQIWGDILPILRSADFRMANLETSITTHPKKWPNKAFNYRYTVPVRRFTLVGCIQQM